MISKYPISTEEQIALIEKVCGAELDSKELQFIIDDIFYVKQFGVPVTIKFSDFDCAVEIRIKKSNADSIKQMASLIEEAPASCIFKGGARQLCNEMREYKREKFGNEYSEECDKYCEIIKYCRGNRSVAEFLSDSRIFKNSNSQCKEQCSEPGVE